MSEYSCSDTFMHSFMHCVLHMEGFSNVLLAKNKEKQITNDYYSSQLCRKTIRNDINQIHLKGNERMTSSS